jgi:aldehyde:ferredoxin oxidoreductase
MNPMELTQMKAAHRVLATLEYPPGTVERGYANRTLHVDLGAPRVDIRPVTPYMKDVFTGGKGFDLFLMWATVPGPIAWDDPRNGLYFSPGPLCGTPYFSGSGKCLVTGISPLTHSVMDCNVGGHFGPLLKFSGFDALEVTGKSSDWVLLVIDGDAHTVTIETAPHEALDSYDAASQLHRMYARDAEDLQNLSVVSAGRGALHSLMGCINMSFYDWKRGEPRLKQAGRGGLGSVMMDKRLKAIVARSSVNRPQWQMTVEAP